MKSAHTSLAVILAIALGSSAFAGGYLLRTKLDDAGPEAVATAGSVTPGTVRVAAAVDEPGPDRRPDFEFVDQDGRSRSLGEFDGSLIVVNFWATWCPPCVHEIPLFVELQDSYAARGLQFVGVALDDTDNVQRFVKEVGMNYPTAHGNETALDLLSRFGNDTGGLPFTALVDRSSRVVFRKAGMMTREEIVSLIERNL